MGGGERVILVHGLWMRPWVMRCLGRRLRAAGFVCRCFAYASTREPFAQALQRLNEEVRRVRAAYLLGHSLGGRLVAAVEAPPAGRALALATPFAPSAAACALLQHGWGRVLGAAGATLTTPAPPPPDGLAVAALAGTAGHGLGRIVAPLPTPHDGTVAVVETHAPWLVDHGCLPFSHSTALIHPQVAHAAAHFFRHGRLPRPPVSPCPVLDSPP